MDVCSRRPTAAKRFCPNHATPVTMLLLLLLGTASSAASDGADGVDRPASSASAEPPANPRLESTASSNREQQGRADADTASAKPKKTKGPKVFGYVQVHLRCAFKTGADSLVDNNDVRVQRVRIGVKGAVNSWLSYDVEIDPRAPEISGVLRDAYLSAKIVPHQTLRFGQQKTQFGYENRESSSRLFAVNRTEISDNLSRGVNLRDNGLGLIGDVKLGRRLEVEDALTVVNGNGLNTQADDTQRKNVWGRVGLHYKRSGFASKTPVPDDESGDGDHKPPRDDLSVRFGVSGGSGDQFDENDPLDPADDVRLSFTRVGADVEIDAKRFFVSAEYVTGTDEDSATGETDDPYGYYVNVVGKTAWRVGPIVRIDTLTDEFRRWTLGAYYGLPDDPFRVLLNYEYREIKDDERGDDKLYLWTQVRY